MLIKRKITVQNESEECSHIENEPLPNSLAHTQIEVCPCRC